MEKEVSLWASPLAKIIASMSVSFLIKNGKFTVQSSFVHARKKREEMYLT